MFRRSVSCSNHNSFFMFGSRGTGKSTLIQYLMNLRPPGTVMFISLLEDKFERRYSGDPDLLISDINLRLGPSKADLQTVVIDEIQKVPKLLDVVHTLIESTQIQFIMTGSSARKLKRHAANLLAGRAFRYDLFPLTHEELGARFNLLDQLTWGALPKIFELNLEDRFEFLRAYAQTYLREEILQEQIVRNAVAFRNFLEIAAQTNGMTLNFAKLSRDIGADAKTVQNYFQILEDTLVGFFLPAFHQSVRKSVKLQPKFYLFDLGVKRALEGALQSILPERGLEFGRAFEHFFICEVLRLNSYHRTDYSLFHYQTTAGGEIDLILKRGTKIIAIEIKSITSIDQIEIRNLERVAMALNPTSIYYISQDKVETEIGRVQCLFWKDFLKVFFDESVITNSV